VIDPFGFLSGQVFATSAMSGVLAGCCSVPLGHGLPAAPDLDFNTGRNKDGHLPHGES